MSARSTAISTVCLPVASVTGRSHHWSVSGGASITSTDQFRVYLNKRDSYAKQALARERFQSALDCILGPWSEWTECPAGCHNVTQERIRKIVQKQYNGGRCYKLKQTRICNQNGCRK